jgi:predicted HTH domain antitoxin
MALPILEPHEFALLTPAMSSEQFDRLLEDVVINGIKEPITIFEGKILDGVNRYRALRACNGAWDLPMVDFLGTRAQAARFVLSKNQHRRHMNASERAILAARVFDAAAKEPALKEDRNWGLVEDAARKIIERPGIDASVVWPPKEGFPVTAPETLKAFARTQGIENVAVEAIPDDGSFDNDRAREEIQQLVTDGYLGAEEIPRDEPAPEKVSQMFLRQVGAKPGRPRNQAIDAAQEAGISRRSAQRAVKIARNAAPEVTAALTEGKISLGRAAEISSLPKSEQAEAISKPSKKTGNLSGFRKILSDISDNPEGFVNQYGPQAGSEILASLRSATANLSSQLEKV